MVDEEDLESALDDLKGELDGCSDRRAALKRVAEDWELHPSLLERKFEERFRVSLLDYVVVDETAAALSVTHHAMQGDGRLFTMRQRGLWLWSLPTPEWRCISGVLVRDAQGRPVVLRSISDGRVYYFPLGSVHPERGTIAELFGTREALENQVAVYDGRCLEPEAFAAWAASEPAPGSSKHAPSP